MSDTDDTTSTDVLLLIKPDFFSLDDDFTSTRINHEPRANNEILDEIDSILSQTMHPFGPSMIGTLDFNPPKHESDLIAEQFLHRIKQLEIENGELKRCNLALQEKIADVQQQASEAHEKKAILERKLDGILEIKELNQKQLRDVEIRLSNSLQSERSLLIENERLRHELDSILLEETKEQNLRLKRHYEAQLDCKIRENTADLRCQLQKIEKELKKEAAECERALTERALNQISLINEQHEQEISLLKSRQKEELELYRIQISNATDTIVMMQKKLETYRERRSKMAQKLHNLMESHWQKILELLTAPGDKPLAIDFSKGAEKEMDREMEGMVSTGTLEKMLLSKYFLPHYISKLLSKSPKEFEDIEKASLNEKEAHRSKKPPWK